ncbi:MAG: PTS sugar transporter subunit IIA [Calditrichota bacterium]
MKLQELLPADRIQLDVSAEDREDAIRCLVNLAAKNEGLSDPEAILRQVLEREKQVGTGIGFGVAIPHAEPGPYAQPLAAFCRLKKGVDFKAPDGQKARLIFLLLTPRETPALHVRLLARICRLTRSTLLRDKLLNAVDPAEVVAIIASVEADYPELTA